MTPQSAKASLTRALLTGDAVTLQRGIAPGPVERAAATIQARFLTYEGTDLVASVKESDRKVIVAADDVAACGLSLPLVSNDRIDLQGRLYTIQSVDDTTRRIGGVLIGYELHVSGP